MINTVKRLTGIKSSNATLAYIFTSISDYSIRYSNHVMLCEQTPAQFAGHTVGDAVYNLIDTAPSLCPASIEHSLN